jgi:hypothetical protein
MDYQGEQSPVPGRIERFGMKSLSWLKTGNPAATMDRLFVSKHVYDLRFIVAVAEALLCFGGVLCLFYAVETVPIPESAFSSKAIKIVTVTSGLVATLVAGFGGISAWAYKAGSTYGVQRVPSVVIDGQLASCCTDRTPDEATLRTDIHG